MNVYILGDIKITTSAEILSVKRITPSINKINVDNIIEEYWSNDYFRKNTKSYFAIKGVEVALRSFNFHQFYLFFREFIYPHLDTVWEYLMKINWLDLFLHVDVAFALGMLTAIGLSCAKRWLCKLFKDERND